MRRFSIGRDEDCDVVVEGKSVSRRHAFVTLRPDKTIHFEDAGSTNGSYLVEGDGLVRIKTTYLRPEAWIQLGKERVSLAQILQAIHERLRMERGTP